MKKTVTSFLLSANWITGRILLGLLVLAVCPTGANSQSTGDQMGLGDLSGINWKQAPELNAVLASEQAKMGLALTEPQLTPDDRALFLSYQRMLAYMADDVQAGNPIEEALPRNYEKVLTEAPAIPDLKHLNPDVFITFMPGLIEALAEVPVPAFGQ